MATLKESLDKYDPIGQANIRVDKLGANPASFHTNENEKVPRFPEDITAVDSETIMRYLTIYEYEVSFIESLIAHLNIKIKHAKHVISGYKRKKFIEYRAKKISVPDATAASGADQEVVEAEFELLNMENDLVILESRRDAHAKCAYLASREMTRRKNESFKPGEGTANNGYPDRAQEDRLAKLKGKDIRDRRS